MNFNLVITWVTSIICVATEGMAALAIREVVFHVADSVWRTTPNDTRIQTHFVHACFGFGAVSIVETC